MLPPLSLFSKTILSEETSLLPLSAPLAANSPPQTSYRLSNPLMQGCFLASIIKKPISAKLSWNQ